MTEDKMDMEEQFAIKPTATTPALDTSSWPLLLKNYDRLLVRTGHFTPIPNGSSPLRRDIKSYVSSGVINLVSTFFFFLSPGDGQPVIQCQSPAEWDLGGRPIAVYGSKRVNTRNRTSRRTPRRTRLSRGSSGCFGAYKEALM